MYFRTKTLLISMSLTRDSLLAPSTVGRTCVLCSEISEISSFLTSCPLKHDLKNTMMPWNGFLYLIDWLYRYWQTIIAQVIMMTKDANDKPIDTMMCKREFDFTWFFGKMKRWWVRWIAPNEKGARWWTFCPTNRRTSCWKLTLLQILESNPSNFIHILPSGSKLVQFSYVFSNFSAQCACARVKACADSSLAFSLALANVCL